MKTIVILRGDETQALVEFYSSIHRFKTMVLEGKNSKKFLCGLAGCKTSGDVEFGIINQGMRMDEFQYCYFEGKIIEFLEDVSGLEVLVIENPDRKVSDIIQEDYEIFEILVDNKEKSTSNSAFHLNYLECNFHENAEELVEALQIKTTEN